MTASNNDDMLQKIQDEAKKDAATLGGKVDVDGETMLKASYNDTVWDILTRLQRTSGAPIDYYSLSMITAVSTAIGNRLELKKNEKWQEMGNIYAVLVGAPGAGKSHPIKTIFQHFYDEDMKNDKVFQKQMDDYESRMAMAKSKDKDTPFTEKPPVRPQNILSDTTYEALGEALIDNPHGICIVSDEIISFLQDLDRGKNGSKDVSFNSIFNGHSIIVNRKGNKRGATVPRPFVSIVGTIQAKLLHQLTKDNKKANGF